MRHRSAVIAEARRTLSLGLPLMGAQVLGISNGLVDTLVAGRIGPTALAAVAIGAGLVFFVTVACIGLMAALSPTMSSLRARGHRTEVGRVFRQGLWMAAAFGLAGFAILLLCRRTIDGWGLDPAMVPSLRDYLGAAVWGLPPAVLLLAARNVCEATSRTRQVLLVQGIGVVVNAVADVVLGLGVGLERFGIEPLGIAGIGWATTLVQLSTCAVLFWLLRRPTFERFALYRPLERPDAARLRQLLMLAAPISLGLLAEAGLFIATAVQMGQLGVREAGAHNIAVTMTAAFYMLPLGLSFALTARTGAAFGKRWWPGVRLRAATGTALALLLAIGSATVIVLLREPIVSVFTEAPDVRVLAAQLLLLAAVFQVSDAMQCTMIGLLRGLHDTRMPMLLSVFSYWAIGFGTGWMAANVWGFGAAGLWFGLIAGLSLSALLNGARLAVILRQHDSRALSRTPS